MSIFKFHRPTEPAPSSYRPAKTGTPNSYESSGPEDFAAELDGLVVVPLDEAPEFHPRPPAAGKTYVEQAGELRAEEQRNHYRALGENLARSSKQLAEKHREEADRETHLIDEHKPVVEKVHEKYHNLIEVLGDAYVRRHPRERRWYHVRMVFLLLGDLVGVAGGAIILGEIPYLAVLQAMAAAVAAITSGLLASEIKDSRLARQRKRDLESLPDQHKAHAHVFQGPDEGEYLVKLMVFGSLTIIVLLGIGMFMLRSSTEGTAAGLVFGMVAMAVAMGSWVNTFHYADELADKVETAEQLVHRTDKRHQELMAMPARGIVAEALATASSIEKEYEELGWAAYRRVMATMYAWHAGRPNIFGHGYVPTESGPTAAGVAPEETEGEAVTPTEAPNTVDLRTIHLPHSTNGQHPEPQEEAS